VGFIKGEKDLKKRTSLLVGCIAAILCLPVGFAIAQSTVAQPESHPVEPTHEDPNPGTNPAQELSALERADKEGNPAAETEAAEAVRQEILSRDAQPEREEAEAAPPAPEVPPGTKSYVAPTVPQVIVSRCEETLAEGNTDELCELVVLHAEGKIRSGAFSPEQQSTVLAEHAQPQEAN
jgi:hypothetical protein